MANGTPIALMTNYLLPAIVPGIEKRIGGMSSLYSFLESEYNLVIEAATDFISARDATPAEAQRLQIPEHSPLLVVRRITHSGGRPIEVAILLIVADKYEYCVHTKDRPPASAERPGAGTAETRSAVGMTLTARDVAQLIDISAVQAPHGAAEIRGLVENAKEYHFIAVHVLPCWVTFLKDLLADSPDILIGAPVGFPGGAHRTEIKVAEAKLLVQDGVQEMDMMLNVGKLRSGELAYCEEDIRAVVCAAGEVPVKVILEVHYLDRDQLKRACEVCIKAGAAFVKTATGWAPSGATLEVVQFITSFVGVRDQGEGGGQHPQPRHADHDVPHGSVPFRHQPELLGGHREVGGRPARRRGGGVAMEARRQRRDGGRRT